MFAAAAAAAGLKPDGRNVISPRMDFDEWTPLGRGDPLKNDPTFDYLPPVLDKVHYWKSPPAPVNRAQQYAAPSAVASSHAVGASYNRRFFLTDLSSLKKEPSSGYVQYAPHKRPQVAAVYHLPKTPLPMLTPPPYQRPQPQTTITVAAAAPAATSTTTTITTTTVEPTDVYSPYSDAVNSGAAESKQPPPTVRVPPPTVRVLPSTVRVPLPPPQRRTTSAPHVSSVLTHSVIKALLENEVDRTAAATTVRTTATSSDPLFAHYKQSAAGTGTPPYLIIQGHSKVKTYGLVSKPDDLSAAARQPAAVHEHNHVGNRPDEPNRRKRDGAR